MAVAVVVTIAACTDAPTRPLPPAPLDTQPSVVRGGDQLKDWLRGYLNDPQASSVPVLAGAGDIAECYHGNPPPPLIDAKAQARRSPAEATAKLLDEIPGTVITVGDNAYQFGTPFDFEACYDPTWGRHFQRTRPSTGNHEYMTPGAAGYFAYFKDRSGLPLPGYYSYDAGSWHVIVLNSTPQVYMCFPPELTEVRRDPSWIPSQLSELPTSEKAGRACAGDVPQQVWLVNDLSTHANYRCTLAYFHHPRFSSGSHGNHYQMQRIWDILYAYGVDVVISAHDHNYERFAPQNPKGKYDRSHGIREFVVGTGGGDLRPVGRPIRNSEVLFTGTHGVITLALNQRSYGWAFVAVDRTIRDFGSGSCHGSPKKRPKLPFALPM
jgi:hypothetical protein